MRMNNFFTQILVVLVLAVSGLTVNAQNKTEKTDDSTQSSNGKLDGTWLATVTFSDGFSLKVLFTFTPGSEDNEGTLIDQNEYQFTPNPVCTADQGVWKKSGNSSYIATHLAFCFDAQSNYDPAGSVKVRDEIRLSRRGDTFTGRQYIQVYDVNGDLTDEFEATMEAARVKPQAPPNVSALPPRSTNPLIQKFGRFPMRKSPQQ